MYENGGVYLDMKIAVLKPLHALLLEKQLELMAIIKERSQSQAPAQGSDGQANASEPFFLAAIGAKKDHIFQGCLVCSKRHPLMMEALVDASRSVQAQFKGNYLKFCKFLYQLIRLNSETQTAEI